MLLLPVVVDLRELMLVAFLRKVDVISLLGIESEWTTVNDSGLLIIVDVTVGVVDVSTIQCGDDLRCRK